MRGELTARQAAEAIEELGDDLVKRLKMFDRQFDGFTPDAMAEFNDLANVEHIDSIALAIRELGRDLCSRCDAAEEAADRAAMVNVGGHRDGGSAS